MSSDAASAALSLLVNNLDAFQLEIAAIRSWLSP